MEVCVAPVICVAPVSAAPPRRLALFTALLSMFRMPPTLELMAVKPRLPFAPFTVTTPPPMSRVPTLLMLPLPEDWASALSPEMAWVPMPTLVTFRMKPVPLLAPLMKFVNVPEKLPVTLLSKPRNKLPALPALPFEVTE